MKRFDVHSFRFRLWAALVGFAVLVCGLMWVVQITTIRTTYENDRIDRLKQAGNIISSTYGREGFADSLRSVARSGFFIQILREDGVLLRSLGNDGADAPPPQEDLVDYGIFARLDGTDGYYFYRVPDTVHDSEWLVQVQVVALQDGLREVLFTSTNMVPVSTTLSMLSSRFLLVTAVVLVVATVLAFLLASNLSRPITQITQRALRLAGGDYGVDFPKGSCTELDHLSHALDTAATEFSNTEALRRDLIANVSHDMRTPLTMIRAYAEMVQQISGDDPVKREAHLDVIVRETEKLTRFVNETLDLSRLQSGTMELNMEVFPLAESVERALGDFRHLWEREATASFSRWTGTCSCGGTGSSWSGPRSISSATRSIIPAEISWCTWGSAAGPGRACSRSSTPGAAFRRSSSGRFGSATIRSTALTRMRPAQAWACPS